MKLNTKTGGLIAMAFVLCFGLFSCGKQAATVAKINVVDTAGEPIENAKVRLYGDPTVLPPGTVVLDDTLRTDAKGFVIFDYTAQYNSGQAGFSVLNIEAMAETLMGTGIIRIEGEKTNEETVIVQ